MFPVIGRMDPFDSAMKVLEVYDDDDMEDMSFPENCTFVGFHGPECKRLFVRKHLP